jgi:hypothetical protein
MPFGWYTMFAATLTSVLAAFTLTLADPPETSPGAPMQATTTNTKNGTVPLDPNTVVTQYQYLGEVTGQASKIDKNTIHLKVPAQVQATNRSRNNGNYNRNSHYHSNSAIRRPSTTTKLVDQHYTLSDNVKVMSINGKEGSLSDVVSGHTIRIHIVKVLQGKPGEKMEHHYEVKSIDVESVGVKK